MFRCSIKPRSILFNLSFLACPLRLQMQSMPPPQVSMAHFLLVLLVFVPIFASVPVSDRQIDISDHLPECERIFYI